MVLADTSVWIEHFRKGSPVLASHLTRGHVLMHAFILGELACGTMKNRAMTLSHLKALPSVPLASNAEVLRFMETRRLWGRGLGWIDVHLLASALLSNCGFWTLDIRLRRAAAELGLNPDLRATPSVLE